LLAFLPVRLLGVPLELLAGGPDALADAGGLGPQGRVVDQVLGPTEAVVELAEALLTARARAPVRVSRAAGPIAARLVAPLGIGQGLPRLRAALAGLTAFGAGLS